MHSNKYKANCWLDRIPGVVVVFERNKWLNSELLQGLLVAPLACLYNLHFLKNMLSFTNLLESSRKMLYSSWS